MGVDSPGKNGISENVMVVDNQYPVVTGQQMYKGVLALGTGRRAGQCGIVGSIIIGILLQTQGQ